MGKLRKKLFKKKQQPKMVASHKPDDVAKKVSSYRPNLKEIRVRKPIEGKLSLKTSQVLVDKRSPGEKERDREKGM